MAPDSMLPVPVRAQQRWALLAVCLAALALPLSFTAGAVAVPVLSRSSVASPTALAWVTNAFMLTFGSLLLAVKLMNQIPVASLTPAAVTAKLKAYTGAIPLGPTEINCTGSLYPADKNSCSDYDQFYQYNGNGQWKLLEGWSNS